MSGERPSPLPGSADLVSGLRGLARGKRRPFAGAGVATRSGAGASSAEQDGMAEEQERCGLCGSALPADHRHMLDLSEREMVCACETCWSTRSGEAGYRPVGSRTIWLDQLKIPDEAWDGFGIPIGLAFFMRTGEPRRTAAFYPSPAGATEAEIDDDAWAALVELNPVLAELEPDCEALIVNRIAAEERHAIAPIDDCYRLVGMIKVGWEGISGGSDPQRAIEQFFAELQSRGSGER